LLNALKEELFALESAKLSGTLAPGEYEEVKAALETVLKRALKRSS
jgi:ribosomal protein L29